MEKKLQSTSIVSMRQEASDVSTPCYVRDSDYDVFSSVRDINRQVTLLRQYLRDLPISERILGIDEEHEYGSRAEFPPNGRDKVGLLQIGYASRGGSTKALLLQVRQMQQLPHQLLELFKDRSITYVGKRVAGDIRNVGDDFKI